MSRSERRGDMVERSGAWHHARKVRLLQYPKRFDFGRIDRFDFVNLLAAWK